jgi:hypothetical protein
MHLLHQHHQLEPIPLKRTLPLSLFPSLNSILAKNLRQTGSPLSLPRPIPARLLPKPSDILTPGLEVVLPQHPPLI